MQSMTKSGIKKNKGLCKNNPFFIWNCQKLCLPLYQQNKLITTKTIKTMTEKDVMFRVLYNPTTKEVYTNPEGNVYDIILIIDDDMKHLLNEGYIIKEVTENGIEGTLNYAETFCYCDRCGKLFLQDDLSFTDEGAPYCSKCYELYETYDVYFQCLGLDIISRGDYESMSCPMYAGEFDDDEMTELAEKIYLCLTNDYRYTDKDLEKYFNDKTAKIDYDLDMAFWREMENIAIKMGMRYYEDMTDEEYEEISKKYGHKLV